MFKNGDKNLMVGRRSLTINLVRIKTFIKKVAVFKGVAKGRPA